MPKEKIPLGDSAPRVPSGPPPLYDAAINQLNILTNQGNVNTPTQSTHQKEKNRNSIGGLLKDVVGAGIHSLRETGLLPQFNNLCLSIFYAFIHLLDVPLVTYFVCKLMSNKEHKYVQSGNVIQLISKASGHSLQILQTPQGQLFMDGTGSEGPSAYNTLFTVYKDSLTNRVTLHNQYNYIAIINGALTLIQGAQTGSIEECYFIVHEVIGSSAKYVVFESSKENGRYLAVNSNGKMKSPLTTSYADPESQFAVRLIYTPNDIGRK